MATRTLNTSTRTATSRWGVSGLLSLALLTAVLVSACARTAANAPPATAPAPAAEAAPPPAPPPASTPAPAEAPPAAAASAGVFTSLQARRGEGFFDAVCTSCHVRSDFSGPQFMSSWGGASAGELFMFISTTMPQDNPASLALQEYADILAYLMRLNGMPAGDRELPGNQDTLNGIPFQKPAE
ncbi:MAG: hypothetical protein AB7P22_01950 [Vicinamibacterales bacterium]